MVHGRSLLRHERTCSSQNAPASEIGRCGLPRRGGAAGARISDVVVIAEDPARRGGGAGLGREVAHLALDDPWIVPAAARLGGHGEDLDEDELNHPAAAARGKTRHGKEDVAARYAPCG